MDTATKKALIIVDVQNDFCEGGSLAVPGSEEIIEQINQLRKNPTFDRIVLTRDYHPQDHISFASNHPEHKVFEEITLPNGVKQVLWPDHCVQGTKGADYHPKLVVLETDKHIKKGMDQGVDSYSGFGTPPEDTGLKAYLEEQGVKEVVCVGLAYDYCVGSTARDAAKAGFKTTLLTKYTRGISEEKIAKMKEVLVDLKVSIKEDL